MNTTQSMFSPEQMASLRLDFVKFLREVAPVEWTRQMTTVGLDFTMPEAWKQFPAANAAHCLAEAERERFTSGPMWVIDPTTSRILEDMGHQEEVVLLADTAPERCGTLFFPHGIGLGSDYLSPVLMASFSPAPEGMSLTVPGLWVNTWSDVNTGRFKALLEGLMDLEEFEARRHLWVSLDRDVVIPYAPPLEARLLFGAVEPDPHHDIMRTVVLTMLALSSGLITWRRISCPLPTTHQLKEAGFAFPNARRTLPPANPQTLRAKLSAAAQRQVSTALARVEAFEAA